MRRPALALTLALGLATAGSVQAQTPVTIDFAEYASPVTREYPAAVGDPLRSNGFDFFATELFVPGARNALATWGTDPSDAGARNRPSNAGRSTALAATQPGDEIDMIVAGDDLIAPSTPFILYSIDLAHLYSTPYVPGLTPFNLNIFGILDSGEDLVQTFTVALPPLVGGARTPLLQTFLFDNRWRNVVNVYWFQTVTSTGAAHQFTNIRAAVAPEPSTYVLMATGLGVLFLVARRRRPTS
jgi:hypothetical protein